MCWQLFRSRFFWSTLSSLALGIFSAGATFAQEKAADKSNTASASATSDRLTIESMWRLGRVGESALSPDGSHIAYIVTRFDLAENASQSEIHVAKLPQGEALTNGLDTASAFGTKQAKLTDHRIILGPLKGLNSLQWVERSKGRPQLVYVAPGEGEPSSPQAWLHDLESDQRTQLTKIADGVSNLKVSPTGKHLAFTIDIKLDSTVQELYPDLPKADARIIDSLMYRHWNVWHDYAYSHLHVAKWNEDNTASEPRDLMPGLRADCPLPPFAGAEQFNFSPDGKEIALTIKLVNNPAESTDSSIFLTGVDGGTLQNITPGMVGYDVEPIYSPDGRWIAFHSMARPGFEADRNRIMLYDRTRGTIKELTEGFDQTTHNARWNHDSSKIFFDSEYTGTQQIYEITLSGGRVRPLTNGTFDFSVVQAASNRELILVQQQNTLRPVELGLVGLGIEPCLTLTDVNEEFFAGIKLPSVDERWVRASDGKQIHNWLILPPDFDPNKTYPLLVFCQGGPQSQVGQWFSYRWNFHLMAAQGYAVLGVNRRGLPGFGQAWNDEISGDWGGQAMRDILAATDSMIAEPYIDAKRIGAVGASFGGYTVYWLMGNAQDRFQAMIAHCGVFNLESMYGSTEEMFFVNWDLRGPYWGSDASRAVYEAFSPHRFAGNWKTPLLVIHGEKDFRVPVTQGIEAFNAAQLQGVPSRFLYFPEEGHWISKPQNSVLWYRVFFDWLDKHLAPK